MASAPVRMQNTIRFRPDFELDLKSYRLLRAGRVVKLERIPMEILLLLLAEPGRIVTREQIVERIWSKEQIFVDTDNSINGAIRKIRQALKDNPTEPRFVQTISGKGYRFIGTLQPAIEEPAAQEPARAQAAVSAQTIPDTVLGSGSTNVGAAPEKRRKWLWAIAVGIAIVLAGVAGAYLRSRLQTSGAAPSQGIVTLAVLPFENLTGDAGQEYFSDGMTEEMIAQLGDLDPQHLRVIARTSVMYYKSKHEPLERIGRELGAQYVLEGSVRRDTEEVRITAQLIQVKDQSHVWARQYDRKLSNLLSLQGEIAQEIAREIHLTLDPNKRIDTAREPALSPAAMEAHDLYLKGRFFWNKRTSAGLEQASKSFQQAIDKDPTYARAYAGLADSYALQSSYGLVPANELMPKAQAAATKALQLDEKLAEAHTSLALISENAAWDWKTAEKEFRRAIELDPNYATAHQWYAEYLAFQGRFNEAFAEIERARELDPLSLIIAADKGALLYYSRQYDQSIEQLSSVRDMEPDFPRGRMVIYAYVEKKQFANALSVIEKWRRSDDVPWTIWPVEAYVYGRAGQREQAVRALKKYEEARKVHRVEEAAPLAGAYAGMNDKDEAIYWLQEAYAEHSNQLDTLKVEPKYDTLRGDPRFQELMRKVGLAQ